MFILILTNKQLFEEKRILYRVHKVSLWVMETSHSKLDTEVYFRQNLSFHFRKERINTRMDLWKITVDSHGSYGLSLCVKFKNNNPFCRHLGYSLHFEQFLKGHFRIFYCLSGLALIHVPRNGARMQYRHNLIFSVVTDTSSNISNR